MPFLVSDVNYRLSGDTPALIPDDYFTNQESRHCQLRVSLPVGRVGSVLSEKMFVEQTRLHWFQPGVDPQGLARQSGNKLQYDRVVNRVVRVLSPREWPVAGHQNRRMLHCIKPQLLERLDNDAAGVRFVVRFDFG